jgi:hypothetical protein
MGSERPMKAVSARAEASTSILRGLGWDASDCCAGGRIAIGPGSEENPIPYSKAWWKASTLRYLSSGLATSAGRNIEATRAGSQAPSCVAGSLEGEVARTWAHSLLKAGPGGMRLRTARRMSAKEYKSEAGVGWPPFVISGAE